jgi:hypothetical protein
VDEYSSLSVSIDQSDFTYYPSLETVATACIDDSEVGSGEDHSGGLPMSKLTSTKEGCAVCSGQEVAWPEEDPYLCEDCYLKSEALFEDEMRKTELIRTIRGRDVELYDIQHPDSISDKNHCGQITLIRAGEGFEVKVCLRAEALDWLAQLADPLDGFTSQDTRLDALIGNVTLLIESWGGGPYYMDIFQVDKVISTEGEI